MDCSGGGLGSICDFQLIYNAVDVIADRITADLEGAANLLVRKPTSDQDEDL